MEFLNNIMEWFASNQQAIKLIFIVTCIIAIAVALIIFLTKFKKWKPAIEQLIDLMTQAESLFNETPKPERSYKKRDFVMLGMQKWLTANGFNIPVSFITKIIELIVNFKNQTK